MAELELHGSVRPHRWIDWLGGRRRVPRNLISDERSATNIGERVISVREAAATAAMSWLKTALDAVQTPIATVIH